MAKGSNGNGENTLKETVTTGDGIEMVHYSDVSAAIVERKDPPEKVRPGTRKNFVLDTNVLLHDPQALFRFGDNNVIIPIYCIEEIDRFKKDLSQLGRSARQVSRNLDAFRKVGHLGEGVPLDSGGTLRVAFTKMRGLPIEYGNSPTQDNSILAVALEVRDHDLKVPTIFITKDVNLRIRADALGLQAADYEAGRVEIDELYSGWRYLDVEESQIDTFYTEGRLSLDFLDSLAGFGPNEYIALRTPLNEQKTAMGRISLETQELIPLRRIPKEGLWGIKARNREQHFAFDILLDDSVKLVTLVGKAGTGKTLLALAAGLQKTAEEKVYQRLLVSRPIFPMGKDLGYLPGDVDAKLNPWMTPIYDNLELLLGLTKGDKKNGRSYREFIDMGLVQIEPLTYIRGRSIPQQYMIVDEAQNLTPHEVKTILTRVGDNTKIILTGDPYQIDNPYVDSSSNGLTYAVQKFQKERIAGHITLSKGERSGLAELAANLL